MFSVNLIKSLFISIKARECEKRWRTLRDQFCRERRKEKSLTPNGTIFPTKKWRYYEMMTFLQDLDNQDTTHYISNSTTTMTTSLLTNNNGCGVVDSKYNFKVSPRSTRTSESSNFSISGKWILTFHFIKSFLLNNLMNFFLRTS